LRTLRGSGSCPTRGSSTDVAASSTPASHEPASAFAFSTASSKEDGDPWAEFSPSSAPCFPPGPAATESAATGEGTSGRQERPHTPASLSPAGDDTVFCEAAVQAFPRPRIVALPKERPHVGKRVILAASHSRPDLEGLPGIVIHKCDVDTELASHRVPVLFERWPTPGDSARPAGTVGTGNYVKLSDGIARPLLCSLRLHKHGAIPGECTGQCRHNEASSSWDRCLRRCRLPEKHLGNCSCCCHVSPPDAFKVGSFAAELNPCEVSRLRFWTECPFRPASWTPERALRAELSWKYHTRLAAIGFACTADGKVVGRKRTPWDASHELTPCGWYLLDEFMGCYAVIIVIRLMTLTEQTISEI
jgi:hypothetical protein